MIDPVWIASIIFLVIAVMYSALIGLHANFWWISPIIGSLIYAVRRKPVVRDSLIAGFFGWFIGTIFGAVGGYVSTVRTDAINIQPFSVDFAILGAMWGGIWAFWAGFICVYETLKAKEKIKKSLQ